MSQHYRTTAASNCKYLSWGMSTLAQLAQGRIDIPNKILSKREK